MGRFHRKFMIFQAIREILMFTVAAADAAAAASFRQNKPPVSFVNIEICTVMMGLILLNKRILVTIFTQMI